MRVALAATLFARPDLLLLDEPTNYLDLEGTLWLESYLARYPYTVIIISHDRDLLNRAVDTIVHLDQGKLTLYRGGYDSFDRQRRERQALQLKLKAKQDDQRRHMQAFVDRFRYKASKARQAQSRLKMLERLEPIAALADNTVVPFHFPPPAKPAAPPIMQMEDVSVGYEAGRPVLRGLNLRLDDDDRIGLLGANGNGKSTLAKLLAGRLEPMGGRFRRLHRLEVAYFAQHQLDELKPALVALRPCPRPDAGRHRSAGARPHRGARLRAHQDGHQGGRPFRRREGAPAARACHLRRRQPADPRRADQPSRHRQPRGAGPGARRVSRRRHPDQPRPPPDRGVGRPAVAGRRRHGGALRRRPRRLSPRWCSTAATAATAMAAAARKAPSNGTAQDRRREAAGRRQQTAPLREKDQGCRILDRISSERDSSP